VALHGRRFYGPAEPMVCATAHLTAEAFFGAEHRVVVLDACHGTRTRAGRNNLIATICPRPNDGSRQPTRTAVLMGAAYLSPERM
jgi:hypothetical protein